MANDSKPQTSTGRLTSFRTPRDLTLGGIKKRTPQPTNKKVFVPNLQIARNKK